MVVEYVAYSLLVHSTSDPQIRGFLEEYEFYILPIVNPDGTHMHVLLVLRTAKVLTDNGQGSSSVSSRTVCGAKPVNTTRRANALGLIRIEIGLNSM